MLDMAALGLRGFLFTVGGIVLGLSISLAKQQKAGPVPSETGFGSAVGALGLAVSGLGLLALWLDSIKTSVVMGMDALVSALYLASGIALSIALRDVTSCTATDAYSVERRATNRILSGGYVEYDGGDGDGGGFVSYAYAFGPGGVDLTPPRCHTARADCVFEFLGFVLGLSMMVLGHVLARRGGTAGARVAGV
ncbi:marvel domain-containing protein [Biscogniauxia marginata]|nr:marvel domain-containing protein [Biscogniauxia marginata]